MPEAFVESAGVDGTRLGVADIPVVDPNELDADVREGGNVWDLLSIPKSVQQTVGHVADVVGAVSTAVSWVGGVQKVLQLAGLLDTAPNPFEKLFSQIQSELRVLLSATIAGATEERLRDVAEQSALAQVAAHIANSYILRGRPDTDFDVAQMAAADRDSRLAVQVMSDPAWWQRTYDPTPAVWQGKAISGETSQYLQLLPWYGVDIRPAKPSGGLIWDYRHILPAYVQAVAARIVVLKARARTFDEFVQIANGPIQGFIAFLTDVHTKIYGAIRSSRLLSLDGMSPSAPAGIHWLRGAGSAEIFSGLNYWVIFRTDEKPQTAGEAVSRHNQIVFESRMKVYEAVGLGELWRIIEDLHRMLIRPCGVPADAHPITSAASVSCIDAQPIHNVAVVGTAGRGLRVLYKHGRDGAWQWHDAGMLPGWTMLQPSRPVITTAPPGTPHNAHIFLPVQDSVGNKHIACYWYDGNRWRWADQGGRGYPTMGNVAVSSFVSNGQRHVRVYVVTGGTVHVNWWNGVEWQWVNLGKPADVSMFSADAVPTVATYRYNNQLIDDLYIVNNGALYEHAWYESGSRSWTLQKRPPGVVLDNKPVAVVHEENGGLKLDVFVTGGTLGSGVRLRSLQWINTWKWYDHGAPPGTTINTDARLAASTVRYADQPPLIAAAVVGADDHVWVHADTGVRRFWYDLTGVTPTLGLRSVLGMSAHVRDNGKLPAMNVFVRGRNDHIHTTEYGFWDPWHDLGQA